MRRRRSSTCYNTPTGPEPRRIIHRYNRRQTDLRWECWECHPAAAGAPPPALTFVPSAQVHSRTTARNPLHVHGHV